MPKSVDGTAELLRKGFGRAETGATAIEYALIVALISVICVIGALGVTSNGVILTYNVITNAMTSAVNN